MNKNLILEGNTIYELDPVCMRTKCFLHPTRQQGACAGCGAHRPEAGSAGKAAAGVRKPGRQNHKMCPLLGAVILSACCRKTGCANR